jgi:putative ABC transport system permease protein
MIRNYLKTAIRNFKKNYLFSLINLIGMSVGLTVSILILLYVFNELNYDKFHKNADNIYRVNVNMQQKDKEEETSNSTPAMGIDLQLEFAAIKNMVRLSIGEAGFFSYKNKNFNVEEIVYADSTLFDIFSFKVINGNAKQALSEPYSLVLTEKTAKQIFGQQDPIGQSLKLNNKNSFIVRAIVEDPPPNSSLQFDALPSFPTLYTYDNMHMGWNGGYAYTTYILLHKDAKPEQIYANLEPFLDKHINNLYKQFGTSLNFYFDPLTDIHLFSKAEGKNTGLSNIYIFSSIAIFILIIACVNFMNLSTARSSRRAREVGIRKVLGGTRATLRWQFLAEAMIISFAALVVALILVELVQPIFNEIINKDLSLYSKGNLGLLLGLFILILIVGLISGSYPAFYLSSFKPIDVLKGGWISSNSKSFFRNALVIFQFFITIVLVISTIVIYKQLGFIKKQELGYNKEQIVYLPLTSENSRNKIQGLKNEIRGLASVQAVGATSAMPGLGFTKNGYFPEGYNEPVMINVVDVDEDFLDVMQIDLLDGESFSLAGKADDKAYLINEVLVKEMGWQEPMTKTIKRDGEHKIIGIVKDFNFAPLFSNVKPLIITNKPWDGFSYLALRMNMNDLPAGLKSIENIWQKILPNEPFDYHFLSQGLEELYENEKNFGRLFIYFSLLAILIACLGLLGLSTFLVEQRTKEIGVRKVFGAPTSSIILLLSRDFARLIILANIVAWPIAYLIMFSWLQRFAYRTIISWWVFVGAASVVFVLAFLTVFYLSLKAAKANPAYILQNE